MPMELAPDRPVAWVTGASGLIGHALVETARKGLADGWRVRGLTRSDLQLEDTDGLRRLLDRDRPDLIVHCAALSRTPACEADPALAYRWNVEVTARLADAMSEGRFVFFSSDLVFDGRRGSYSESDPPGPVNVYGKTKWAAEQALHGHPNALILRTSLNYGHSPSGDRAFNEEMVNHWRAGRSVKMFVDEYRCPIAARVTAEVTWELVAAQRTGVVHLAGSERLSRWEIASAIQALHPSLGPRIEPVSLRDFVGPPRAADVSLDCSRLAEWRRRPLPAFRLWLVENESVAGTT